MPLERVRASAVRCIHAADVALGSTWNYVFGPNGAGKTSFLEAIHLLGRGRSFRTRHTERLVESGERALTVVGTLPEQGLTPEIRVRFEEGRLEAQVGADSNGGLVALARALPVQVIDPQLHDLIEGGPSARRRYLDAGVFHVEQTYLDAWRAYRRVLAQRNHALRNSSHAREVAAWTTGLADAGERVDRARALYVEPLARHARAIGTRLLGREVDLEYRCGWRQGRGLAEALGEALERDREAGHTQTGPHRADLVVRLGGDLVRDSLSRGQQKLVAAALVLAQVATFEAATGHGGTLLVDDPGAELDSNALARLLAELESVHAQLVVTGLTEAAFLPLRPGAPVFHVERGAMRAVL